MTQFWILFVLFSALAGAFGLLYLMTPRRWMNLYLVAALALVLELVFIGGKIFPSELRLAGLGSGALSFVAGYIAATMVFLARSQKRPRLPVTRQPDDPGDGHTAVIYFTHGEPESYSYWPWLETFRELDAANTPFVPRLARPFFLNTVRREYARAGGSPHNMAHMVMLEALKNAMLEPHKPPGKPEMDAQAMRFYPAFRDSAPRPDEAAIHAIHQGAARIILLNVWITQSGHTQEGREMLEALPLDEHGVSLYVTTPLWDSETLRRSFVERANRAQAGLDKSKTGILLVGYGQPEEWDVIYTQQSEQEQLYLHGIKNSFIQNGYPADQILPAWIMFRQPGVTVSVKALAGTGVERILVFAASISAASIHSQYKIPAQVKDAGLPPGVEVVHMGAWGDDKLAIEALRERVEECEGRRE